LVGLLGRDEVPLAVGANSQEVAAVPFDLLDPRGLFEAIVLEPDGEVHVVGMPGFQETVDGPHEHPQRMVIRDTGPLRVLP
jgi:hypothetical protein